MKETGTARQVKSICRMCHGGCGVVLDIQDENVVGISGDKENPNNRGFLCAKGRASLDLLRHPDRLKFPLKRVGRKGSHEFARITWEEAYDTIIRQLEAARSGVGPESVVFAQGTDRNYQEWVFRLANSFGSPNVLGPAHVCFYPRIMAGILTMGDFTFCDYEGTPACLLLWGSNKIMTNGDGVIGTRLLAAQKRGTRLVVVDPRRTELARRATHWLQIRPGTDAVLALAMLHVIISSGKFDAGFVEKYTYGFERLAEHVRPYTPEVASEITSVPADLIREAACFYADARPAAIEAGTGIEQNRNSFHTARTLYLLSGICGNIDRPGGDVIWQPSGIIGRRTFPLHEALAEPQRGKRLGSEQHRILGMASWAHPEAVWKAILEGDPYPVRAMLVFGSNLLVNYANSDRTEEALRRLPFLAVSDLFLTPTAAMADIILPASGWLERDQIVEHAHYTAARRKVAQVGECRSDEHIIVDLARGLGLSANFWDSAEEALDYKLKPIGESWDSFADGYYRANVLEYFKYKKSGFRTRNGKFNLFCEGLARFGYAPLPSYTPVESGSDAGSYVLTCAHSPFYFNSEFRNINALRRREQEPVAELHPETAHKEGICDSDWVLLSANGKSARFRVRVTDGVAREVICVAANWWFPGKPFPESWQRSNINRITSDRDNNPEMGSPNFRGIRCRLTRAAKEEPSQTSSHELAVE